MCPGREKEPKILEEETSQSPALPCHVLPLSTSCARAESPPLRKTRGTSSQLPLPPDHLCSLPLALCPSGIWDGEPNRPRWLSQPHPTKFLEVPGQLGKNTDPLALF